MGEDNIFCELLLLFLSWDRHYCYNERSYPVQLNRIRSPCWHVLSWRWTLHLLHTVNTWRRNEHWKLCLGLAHGAVVVLVVFKVGIQVWRAAHNTAIVCSTKVLCSQNLCSRKSQRYKGHISHYVDIRHLCLWHRHTLLLTNHDILQ